MKPYFDEIERIIRDKTLYHIHGAISDYHDACVYELERIDRLKTITNYRNQYAVSINLYYLTKDSSDVDHIDEAIDILLGLEAENARIIQEMETNKIIINGTEYTCTRYGLKFEPYTLQGV